MLSDKIKRLAILVSQGDVGAARELGRELHRSGVSLPENSWKTFLLRNYDDDIRVLVGVSDYEIELYHLTQEDERFDPSEDNEGYIVRFSYSEGELDFTYQFANFSDPNIAVEYRRRLSDKLSREVKSFSKTIELGGLGGMTVEEIRSLVIDNDSVAARLQREGLGL